MSVMTDHELERRLLAIIRDAQPVHRALIQILESRREQRRAQHEAAMGEQASVLRGHCRELTQLINDLNQPKGG